MLFSNQNLSNEGLFCLVVAIVMISNNWRERSNLTRSALLDVHHTPWRKLLCCGDDHSFLHVTGFTRTAFWKLIDITYPSWNQVRRGVGRPSPFKDYDKVGLALLYLGSKMNYKHLCMTFGIVPSSVATILRKVLSTIVRRLKSDNAAMVEFPNEDRKAHFSTLVQRREPAVGNIIGFADGLSLPVQCSEDEEIQAEYYSGHLKDTMINNVFVFSPEGKIIHATTNCPGSWHDSNVAVHLMAKVEREIGNYAICVDQGFPRKGSMEGKFVGPLSRRARTKLQQEPPDIRRPQEQLHAVYTSLRQAAEWGMKALQGTFGRLKTRLTSNKKLRKLILACIVFLHNFRTHYVGINQIAEVFNLEYEQYISLETYDRIRAYFNF